MTEPTWIDHIDFAFEDDYLYIALKGRWMTLADSAAARASLVDSGLWQSTMPVLVDFTDSDLEHAPDVADLRKRTEGWMTLSSPPPRVALLTRKGVTLGIVEIIQQLWSPHFVSVFTDKEKALAWLRRGQT